MSESLEPTAPNPEAWIAGLRARGIRLWVKNNRLRTSDFKALTPDDKRFIDAHRADIKRLVEANPDDPFVETPAAEVKTPEVKTPEVEPLDPAEYRRHGLFKMRGVLTHAWGDEFAQQVLHDPKVRIQAVAMARRAAEQVAELTRQPVRYPTRSPVRSSIRRGGTWGR